MANEGEFPLGTSTRWLAGPYSNLLQTQQTCGANVLWGLEVFSGLNPLGQPETENMLRHPETHRFVGILLRTSLRLGSQESVWGGAEGPSSHILLGST